MSARSPTPEEMAKVQLLVKLIQNLKTREIFEDDKKVSGDEVLDILELSQSEQNSSESTEGPSTQKAYTISILATMKSIAHTIQSQARWKKFCEDNKTDELVYTFSSKGDFTHVSHVTDCVTLPVDVNRAAVDQVAR